jgi:Mce-associated membrane protein
VARHAVTADAELTETTTVGEAAADKTTPNAPAEESSDVCVPHSPAGRPVRSALMAASLAVTAIAGVGGWLTYHAYQEHQQQLVQDQFLAVGRQAAVNLTTIDFTNADADVARILAGATGPFLDDFQKRAQPFIEVVKQVKSTSVGTVTEAGLESVQGDRAQVLVSLRVKTVTEGNPESKPKQWRMRIDVQKVGSDVKVENAQFVP